MVLIYDIYRHVLFSLFTCLLLFLFYDVIVTVVIREMIWTIKRAELSQCAGQGTFLTSQNYSPVK